MGKRPGQVRGRHSSFDLFRDLSGDSVRHGGHKLFQSIHRDTNHEYVNLHEEGLANLIEIETMFPNMCATSKHPQHLEGGGEGEGENEAIEEEENIEVIRTVKTKYSGYDDFGLENIEIDNIDCVEQEGTTADMQSWLDHIEEAAERCVLHFTAMYVSNDLPDCSITKCTSLLKTLPSIELGSELYMLGVRLFIKEMFFALEDDGISVSWLEDELDLIKEGKHTSRH
ncbi:hypothetical protein Cgig2_030772 [Carnegiea gigantea]|uniref:Uncharacterized protein n=1 Tax=Carnegiea gigantea TaxID=171969 RepID=A0A9Q1KQE7_9CARY|nr:hypothetical protein Cgig2_030772 [Carnegiea gigantea]